MHIENLTISGATFRGIITDFNAISGGTVTYYNNYTIHTITANTVLTIESLGTVNSAIELFLLGGGGGGGSEYGSGMAGGGGGGGGFFYNSNVNLPVGQYNVVVGNGGAGANTLIGTPSTRGEDTTLAGMVALGGGPGGPGSLTAFGTSNTYFYQTELSGGNGGGSQSGRFSRDYHYLGGLGLQDGYTQPQTNQVDGAGSGYGSNSGGEGYQEATNTYRFGGGGGAHGYLSTQNVNATTSKAGDGGGWTRNSNPISGSTLGTFVTGWGYMLGAGGGGGAWSTSSATRGLGGTGGGGAGGYGTTMSNGVQGQNGTTNFGAGGGGGVGFSGGTGVNGSGGNGGSGVVIIRYRNS